jgi:glycosyltransferase involved in cell wall biosynthesis
MRKLTALEQQCPDAEVLVVTSAWPHPANPASGIFIKREQDALRALGVRADVLVVRGYASRLAYPAATIRLVRAITSRGYRIVHAYGGESALAASVARRGPLVVTYLGSDLLGAATERGGVSIAWRGRRRVMRAGSRLPRRTITRSAQMEAALPAAVRRRNSVLPAGVDETVFRPMSRQEARATLGWPADERVVLYASNPAVPGKRYRLAAEAVEASGLANTRLHVLDGVAPGDVPIAMNAADCLLFSSAREGSPNVVKEAVMCNLPVVATRAGDIDLTLDGVEPSWICGDDAAELGAALIECLTSPTRSNGRAHAGRLTAHSVAERIVAVYEDALGAPLSRGAFC